MVLCPPRLGLITPHHLRELEGRSSATHWQWWSYGSMLLAHLENCLGRQVRERAAVAARCARGLRLEEVKQPANHLACLREAHKRGVAGWGGGGWHHAEQLVCSYGQQATTMLATPRGCTRRKGGAQNRHHQHSHQNMPSSSIQTQPHRKKTSLLQETIVPGAVFACSGRDQNLHKASPLVCTKTTTLYLGARLMIPLSWAATCRS